MTELNTEVWETVEMIGYHAAKGNQEAWDSFVKLVVGLMPEDKKLKSLYILLAAFEMLPPEAREKLDFEATPQMKLAAQML